MRIAYHLNDGTRKIGNEQDFQRDYDAGVVDANRRSTVEMTTVGDVWAWSKARAFEASRREILREEKKAERFDAISSTLAGLAPTLRVGGALAILFFFAVSGFESDDLVDCAIGTFGAFAFACGGIASAKRKERERRKTIERAERVWRFTWDAARVAETKTRRFRENAEAIAKNV